MSSEIHIDPKSFQKEAKKNPDRAFHMLVNAYSHMIYNLCLQYAPNKLDAEDLTQEVFAAAYKNIHTFQGNAKVSTWIYSIALNKSKEFLRNQSRQKRSGVHIEIQQEDGSDKEFAIHFDHPGVKLEHKEEAQIVFQAIESLPDNQRDAFILHRIEGKSYEEISEILNTSLSSVESLMFRAKKKLKEILHDYYHEKNS